MMTSISVATGVDDFTAVRRFWYRIYCVQRGVLRDQADHAAQELNDPLLERATVFIARQAGQICGTLMVTRARDGDLGFYADFYELRRLPEFPQSVFIVTKVMVAPELRGGVVPYRLLRAALTQAYHEGMTHAVCDCNEPLDRQFEAIGCREFLGWKAHPHFGRVRVMIMRLRDDAHRIVRRGGPFAPCAETAFKQKPRRDKMESFKLLREAFQEPSRAFMSSPPIESLTRGHFGVAHYAAVMRQIFHQARENPQIQALATVRFRGAQRRAVEGFYRHALSEIGHDELALNDYRACGGDASRVPFEHPHPATAAVTAFAHYQIYNGNPAAYLGYLFFLEFLPTSQGEGLMRRLRQVGVPENALSFLGDHVRVDPGHNQAMERYCEQLIQTRADLEAAIYALRATGYLYTRMIEAAVDSVDTPQDFGLSPDECAHGRLESRMPEYASA